MVEEKWLKGTELKSMLDFIQGKGSQRKLRLLACACCREALHLIGNDHALDYLELAERLADGTATEEDVDSTTAAVEVMIYEAEQDRRRALEDYHDEAGPLCGCPSCEAEAESRWAEKNVTVDGDFGYRSMEDAIRFEAAGLAAEAAWHALAPPGSWRKAVETVRSLAQRLNKPVQQRLGRLIRDLFGNPFRPATVDPNWLRWDCEALPKMARKIYDERAFELLPIVADALQEAGCKDAQILDHCRTPGVHVRGCWLVDLLLGKE